MVTVSVDETTVKPIRFQTLNESTFYSIELFPNPIIAGFEFVTQEWIFYGLHKHWWKSMAFYQPSGEICREDVWIW